MDTIDQPESTLNNQEQFFPGILERLKAIIVDSLVIVGLMFVIGLIFSKIEDVPDQARMIAFIFVFGLYDPIFTSLFGGTIGHMIIGIRVKRDENLNKNILFPYALIRYVIKVTLGWVSLVTISANDKGKAIHDVLANSVVVYHKK